MPNNKEAEEGEKPTRTVTVWPVQISMWENERKRNDGSKFVATSFKLQRTYTEDKGKTWKNTPYLRFRDLPLAILAMQKIFEAEATKKNEKEDEE